MIVIFIIIAISMVLIAGIASLGSEEKEPAESPDQYGLISKDYEELRSMVLVATDDYLTGYEFSPELGEWKFSKDTEKDMFIISSSVTLKESSKKQPLTCILTWKKMKASMLFIS